MDNARRGVGIFFLVVMLSWCNISRAMEKTENCSICQRATQEMTGKVVACTGEELGSCCQMCIGFFRPPKRGVGIGLCFACKKGDCDGTNNQCRHNPYEESVEAAKNSFLAGESAQDSIKSAKKYWKSLNDFDWTTYHGQKQQGSSQVSGNLQQVKGDEESSHIVNSWECLNVGWLVFRAVVKCAVLHGLVNRLIPHRYQRWGMKLPFTWDLINTRIAVEVADGMLQGGLRSGCRSALSEGLLILVQEQLMLLIEKGIVATGVPCAVEKYCSKRFNFVLSESLHAFSRIAIRSFLATVAYNLQQPSGQQRRYVLAAGHPRFCQMDEDWRCINDGIVLAKVLFRTQ